MRLLEVDLNSERYETDSRSYLLLIGKKCIKEGPLFFASYFLPLTKKLVSAKKNEESEIKQKKITVLLEQIWDLFPNYCEGIDNFETAFKKLLPTIKLKLSQNNNNIIRSIAIGFTKIVNILLESKNISIERKNSCIGVLRDIATEYLKKFTEIYMSYSKERVERKEILQAIGSFSQCLEPTLLDSIYKSESSLILSKVDVEMNGDEVNELCKKIDILSVLSKGLALTPENFALIKGLVDKYIDHYEYSIQKKIYLIILTLIKKPGTENLADAIGVYNWIKDTKQPVAKIGRARIISAIIDILSKLQNKNQLDFNTNIEGLINSLLPELVALLYSNQKKARDEALNAVTVLSHVIFEKGGLIPLFKKILAGLAGKSQEFRISTLILLGRLLYEHHTNLPPEFIMEISNVIILLLKDNDKRVVKEVMSYVKILVSVLSKEKIEEYIDLLANGLLVWTGKFKQDLRMKIRYIFAKLIKKTSAEFVKSKVLDVDKSLIDYICKMMRRERNIKKRKKATDKKEDTKKKYEKIVKDEDEKESEGEEQKMESEDEEAESILSDTSSDIPEEEIPIISNEKEDNKETGELLEDRIEKMMNAPENELDTHFFKGHKVKKQKETKEESKDADMDVYIVKESGKLIVKDEVKPRKRKATEMSKEKIEEDSNSESEEMPRKKKIVEEKGKVIAEKVKVKKPEGHFEVHTGEEYRGKAGKSDAWKKGQKFEPHAYIRFNPKVNVLYK